MMTSRLFKILLILSITSLAAGCKLAVMASSGGDVISASGTRDCAAGNVCEFTITDTDFSETFTAVPKPGYQFVSWIAASKDVEFSTFFCGDSTNATCTVDMSSASNPQAVVDSFVISYIIPDFKYVGN